MRGGFGCPCADPCAALDNMSASRHFVPFSGPWKPPPPFNAVSRLVQRDWLGTKRVGGDVIVELFRMILRGAKREISAEQQWSQILHLTSTRSLAFYVASFGLI